MAFIVISFMVPSITLQFLLFYSFALFLFLIKCLVCFLFLPVFQSLCISPSLSVLFKNVNLFFSFSLYIRIYFLTSGGFHFFIFYSFQSLHFPALTFFPHSTSCSISTHITYIFSLFPVCILFTSP